MCVMWCVYLWCGMCVGLGCVCVCMRCCGIGVCAYVYGVGCVVWDVCGGVCVYGIQCGYDVVYV